jgi:hypothetical protein
VTLWHKPAFTALDRDPATGDLLPGPLPPGLYCEDDAAFAKLRAAARLRNSAVRGTLDVGWDLAGQAVFVCTPEQARTFRAIASKAPPPPVEPSYEETTAAFVSNMEKEARALGLELSSTLQAKDAPRRPRRRQGIPSLGRTAPSAGRPRPGRGGGRERLRRYGRSGSDPVAPC